jgi:hypothetical protein
VDKSDQRLYSRSTVAACDKFCWRKKAENGKKNSIIVPENRNPKKYQ